MEQIIPLILKYKYFIIFPIVAIEGPAASLVIGFLVRLGYLNFLPSYIILIFGDLIPDTIYYFIGRFGNKKNFLEKYKKEPGFIADNFQIIEHLWKNHGGKTMFLSKLAYGLSTPFLISAGLANMPLKRFLSYTLPVILFQYAAIMSIGYYLGQSYQAAVKYVEDAGIIIALVIIILIGGYVIFAKYARKKLIKMERDPIHKSL